MRVVRVERGYYCDAERAKDGGGDHGYHQCGRPAVYEVSGEDEDRWYCRNCARRLRVLEAVTVDTGW